MPYITTALNDSISYRLEVLNAVGSTAVTIMKIKNNGSITAESLVNPNGLRTIGNGFVRMVFISNCTEGGNGLFRVLQSSVLLCEIPFGSSAPLDLTVTFPVV